MTLNIKICEKNRNEIAKLIESTERRCSVRCFGSVERFEREFSKFTSAYGNLPKSAMVGCVVEFRAYCKPFPNAYKYTPETTLIRVEFKKAGCYITAIERVNANCSSRHEREIVIMSDAMKNRIMENAHYFRCSHHERAVRLSLSCVSEVDRDRFNPFSITADTNQNRRNKIMVRVINLTPHDVVIVTDDEKITFPTSGTIARCKSASVPVSVIETEAGAITLVKTEIGEPENVPEAQDGTIFIVSRLIKSALPERADLVCPDGLVRDESGNVIGAERFSL